MNGLLRLDRVILLAILIAGAVLVLAAFVNNQQGAAAPLPAPIEASSLPQSSPETSQRVCVIANIFVTADRWHVRCTTAQPLGVVFYAIEGDAAHKIVGDRMLVLVNTAYALGKPIDLQYEGNSSLNPPNCLVANCRRLSGVGLNP